ncbi:DUF1269 domain-containing protein [Georgenia yuyongxinii]|nr:DUF1269 domain-containing protein [Georgenia yuyongxinii]
MDEALAASRCDVGVRESAAAERLERRLGVLDRPGGSQMAFDTLIVFAGVYPDVESAETDYDLVKELHTKERLMDAYDAAVIHRREDGKVKITRKHETPTRVGGVLGGGAGLATGLVVALFPFAAVGGGLLAATSAGGALLGAVAGHAAAGMSREDLKELGESLDNGEAGLVVVGVMDMEARIEDSMRHAEKLQKKQLRADVEALERDAKDATEQ